MDFNKQYKKLNPAQKEAVNTLEGPVMVIAGPGSGKTQILTMRIANILKQTDTDPQSILALTFTESGAKAMKERLISFIGEAGYKVNITTFHSFASQVIMENPDEFLITSEYAVASDLQKLNIVKQIINETNLNELKPANSVYFYAKFILFSISNLKREGVTYKKYKSLVKDNKKQIKLIKQKQKLTAKDLKQIKDLTKQIELKKVYKLYQQQLKQQKLYDFEDLINFCIEKFNVNEGGSKQLLQTYQEKFQYILVDEFQDTNNAQFEILKHLTSYWGEQSNIFTVGDDDQSIFRFQGASVENMIQFVKLFPNAKLINLNLNYRSTPTVVRVSNDLITKNSLSIKNQIKTINKDLKAYNKELGPKIKLHKFSHGVIETYYVAKKVKKLIQKGVNPSDIAIIYRNNSDSEDILHALNKLGINYNLEGGANILQSEVIVKLLTLLSAINNTKQGFEDVDLFTLFNFKFLNFNSLNILKLSRFASKRHINLFEAIQTKEFTSGKVVDDPQPFIDFVTKKIPKWQQVDSESVFTKTFEVIINQSGFLNYLLNEKTYIEDLNKINSLYEEIKLQLNANPNLKLNDFLANIQTLNENYLKIGETDFDIKDNSVTLTTAHKSKGLEFKYVFLVKVIDKKWGNNRNIEYIKLPSGIVKYSSNENSEDEERRLFYVALTRAKKQIYISYSNEYSNSWGLSSAQKSQFILELNKKYVKQVKIIEQKYVKAASQVFLTPPPTKISNDEKKFLTPIIENYKISVTGLNTYLQCGYKFKLNTLLKTPRAKAPYLSLGTAIHKALENFYKSYIAFNDIPSLQFLVDEFKKALSYELLTDNDKALQQKKGIKILNKYYEQNKQNFKKPEYLERLFGYGFSKIQLGDIPLVGKVDRIDLIKKDGATKYVKVVDYKTGGVKSKNDIEGNTKYSDGSLKRQLVFYKILCDLDKSFNYKMVEAELDFVGDGKAQTKPVKHSFKISDKEVNELKQLIAGEIKKIRALKFNKTTDYSVCQNCDYKNHCWPGGIPKQNQIVQNSLGL